MFAKIYRMLYIIWYSRDILKKFLVEKDNLLFKNMKLNAPDEAIRYISGSDLLEIDKWKRLDCVLFLRRLSCSATLSCPWCMLYHENCQNCGYGIRHGRCLAPGSLYVRVMKITGTLIVPGMHELIEKYQWDSLMSKGILKELGFYEEKHHGK